MPSFTLDASKQFVQAVSDLQQSSSANSAGDVLTDALNVYNLLKRITPVTSDGKQQLTVKTTDGKEYNIILP